MRKLLLSFTIVALFTISLSAYVGGVFEPGYYYNAAGEKQFGFVNVQQHHDYILFKADKDASYEKIKIEDIKSVVFTHKWKVTDTLMVVTEDGKDKRYFAKAFLSTPTMRFFYKAKYQASFTGPSMVNNVSSNPGATGSQSNFTNNIGWKGGTSADGEELIPMYQDGETTRELTSKNFIEVLSKAFADFPDLAEDITNKAYKFKRVDEIFQRYKDRNN